MIISDTSALVLHWTSKDIWKSKNALEYFAKLDISASNGLIKQFDETENYMHTQAVSNRKFFVRKRAVEFLENCRQNNTDGQVIILAAGIAPLSVEIASLFPESNVFDIDKYLMGDKEKFLDGLCPNIKFIETDITDIIGLEEKLMENGWDTNNQTLVILEGIIYYISEIELCHLIMLFDLHDSEFTGDFGLKPEDVNEKNRIYGTAVFRKIQESVGIAPVSLYDPEYFMQLLQECGLSSPQRFTMGDVQYQRTGERKPFEGAEPGWISMFQC